MGNPLISIIIPVYNCEKYLKRCLDSVFEQDYDNYEVLCVDDGSTDKSSTIINNYKANYIYQDNQGQAAARNKGITLAKGEWICFIDADDSIEHNYLSKLVEGTKENVDMVVCHIRRINEDGSNNVDLIKKRGILTSKEALVTINLGPTNKLIRKSIVGNSRFEEGKLRFEDVLFTPELIINSKAINVIDDVLYNYYVRENSTMRRFDSTLDDIFIILDKLINRYYYGDYKEEIDYIVFKNGLFGHFSRIVYFDKDTIRKEIDKAKAFILKNVPEYRKNKYIMKDKQPYFYVGTRLFSINMLNVLVKPLKILEKNINR